MPSEKILQKTLVTSGLNSAQWNQVQAGLRDRAFFSSRVESALLPPARSPRSARWPPPPPPKSGATSAPWPTPKATPQRATKDQRPPQRLVIIRPTASPGYAATRGQPPALRIPAQVDTRALAPEGIPVARRASLADDRPRPVWMPLAYLAFVLAPAWAQVSIAPKPSH